MDFLELDFGENIWVNKSLSSLLIESAYILEQAVDTSGSAFQKWQTAGMV